jgi:hypothetical protein
MRRSGGRRLELLVRSAARVPLFSLIFGVLFCHDFRACNTVAPRARILAFFPGPATTPAGRTKGSFLKEIGAASFATNLHAKAWSNGIDDPAGLALEFGMDVVRPNAGQAGKQDDGPHLPSLSPGQ